MTFDLFSGLPKDIKLEIFDYVRSKPDQGNVCLVNRECKNLMMPRMWRQFTTRLLPVMESGPDAEQYGHIRELEVRYNGQASYNEQGIAPFYSKAFRNLVDCLEEDGLLDFKCAKERPLNGENILDLLDRQQNIRSFSAAIDLSDVPVEDRDRWVNRHKQVLTSSFRGLTSLTLWIANRLRLEAMPDEYKDILSHDEIESNFRHLIIHSAPLIRDLELRGRPQKPNRVPTTLFFNDLNKSTNILPALTRLVLANMDLTYRWSDIFDCINFCRLHSLSISRCVNINDFMSALESLAIQQQLSLKEIAILLGSVLGTDRRAEIGSIERLLCNMRDLEELIMDYDWRFNWEKVLARHQHSLKRFLIGSLPSEPEPNGPLDCLARCPQLEQFAYNCPEPHLKVPTDNRYLNDSLDMIASASSVRILRLLYAPNLRALPRSTGRERLARLLQDLANYFIQRLTKKGSGVKLLAFSPFHEVDFGDTCHNSGHSFPHYYFRTETVEVEDEVSVKAIPFPNCLQERPDAVILKPYW